MTPQKKPAKDRASHSLPVIPGAPAAQPPSLGEPTSPVNPLPPKEDQQHLANVTATGSPFTAGADAGQGAEDRRVPDGVRDLAGVERGHALVGAAAAAILSSKQCA